MTVKVKDGIVIASDKPDVKVGSSYDVLGTGGKPATTKELKEAGAPSSLGSKVASTPSLINTSTQSKTTYSNNLNTLNNANANIRQVQSGQTASGIAMSLGITPEKFLELNPNFAAPGVGGTKGDYKGLDGTIKPGMTYKVGPDGSSTPVEEALKPDANGNTTITDDNDGTTTTTKKDGTTEITTEDGTVLDPTLKKQFDDNYKDLTTAANNAKTIMDQAAATMKDDPAAVAAANNIKAKYDILIEQMKEKNRMLLGGINKNSARTGMLQYANEMDSNFKSMEFDKSVQRIADLVDKENEAVAKSNAAYKSGDVKAFNAATKEYESAVKDKQKSILDLNKAISDAVKANATEIKLKRDAEKQAITDDIRVSATLGKTMADAISNSGITDETKIDEYVKAMAEANGITNPNILKNSLIKEQQAADTLSLKNKNTASIIANRGKTKTGTNGKPKFVISNAIATVTPQFEAAKGADDFVSPENWLAGRTNWNNEGGTDASYNTTFKKYLNPESYPLAGFKAPKATAGAGFKK